VVIQEFLDRQSIHGHTHTGTHAEPGPLTVAIRMLRLPITGDCVGPQTVVVDGITGRVIWSFNTTKSEMSSDLVMRSSEPHRDFFVFRANGRLFLPHGSSQQRVIVDFL